MDEWRMGSADMRVRVMENYQFKLLLKAGSEIDFGVANLLRG